MQKNLPLNKLLLALHQKDGRNVVANYGLDPLLGKYHKTTCDKCLTMIDDVDAELAQAVAYKGLSKVSSIAYRS